MGIFGSRKADKAKHAIEAEFPDLMVATEVQKQTFGKVLLVVVYGNETPGKRSLSAQEAHELPQRSGASRSRTPTSRSRASTICPYRNGPGAIGAV